MGITTSGEWRVKHVSRGRGLSGANGCRFGPDGALYNASAFGSEVARVDIDTGELTIVSPRGDGIVSPDDLAFDSAGILYVSECMDARVTAFRDGETWVVEADIPGVNGIAIWEDRIFVDQFFPGGGLFEVFRDDRPRIQLAGDLLGPNGCCVGPDGFIYFALVFPGELRRVPVDGGEVELVADGLAAPSSCRVGPDHAIYVSQGGAGQITRLDPVTGELQTIYEGRPGIDNFDINPDGRICISYYLDGAICEVVSRTEARELVAPALLAPYGIAVADGAVQVADGFSAARLTDDGRLERAGKITDAGFPGYIRGLAAADRGVYVTNSAGAVGRWSSNGWTEGEVWADGLGEVMGVSALPGSPSVAVAVADHGHVASVSPGGEVETIGEGFERPAGVAAGASGELFVTDEARGTLERLARGRRTVVAEGLNHPQDLAVRDGRVLVVEAGTGRVLSVDPEGGGVDCVASGMPVGDGAGGIRSTLNGLPNAIPGPMPPFAGIDVDEHGVVYVAGDAQGVVVTLEPGAPEP
jgi:sugar lactone lactonase YvrE